MKNFEKAKEWYGRILGLNKGEKYFNHLFAAETPAYQTPAIQFVTNDLQASFQYMKDNEVDLETEIEDNF